MATIKLRNGTTVTVPDEVADSYTSRGRVRHGAPAPAEHGQDVTRTDEREQPASHGRRKGKRKPKATE